MIGTTTTTVPDHGEVGLRAWPFRWLDAGRLLIAYGVFSVLWIGVGLLVVGPLDSTVGALDRRVTNWMVAHRTPTGNTTSHDFTLLAETGVKILVTLLIALVVLAIWRSWADVMIVCGALVLEASSFLTITLVVGRHRPDVPRLDGSPVNSSFPSGHTAAAAAYVALAVVLWRHLHRRAAIAVVVLVTAIIGMVAWARMYRGMHYLSDVIFGALLGVASVVVATRLVMAAERRAEREAM